MVYVSMMRESVMHVCMMYISMIFDPGASMGDAYIYHPW